MKTWSLLLAILGCGMSLAAAGCGDGRDIATMNEDDKQKFEAAHKQAGTAAAAGANDAKSGGHK